MARKTLTKTGLDYFPLDVDVLQDPKLQRLIVKHGSRGIGILVRLLCGLYRHGYCLPWGEDAAESFAWESREPVDTVRDVVEVLVSQGFFDRRLASGQTPVLTSAGIQRRYLNVTSRRVNRSIPVHLDLLLGETETEDRRQYVGSMSADCSQYVGKMSAECMQTVSSLPQDVCRSSSGSIPSQKNIEASSALTKASDDSMSAECMQDADSLSQKGAKGKESKGKESKEKTKQKARALCALGDLVIPSELDSESIRQALEEWIEHRSEIKKPITARGLKALLKNYANRPTELERDISVAIASGWQGVFPSRTGGGKSNSGDSRAVQRDSRMRQLILSAGVHDGGSDGY